MKRINFFVAAIMLLFTATLFAADKPMTRNQCLNKFNGDYNMQRLQCQKDAGKECTDPQTRKTNNTCYSKSYNACNKKRLAELKEKQKSCPKR